MTKIVKSHYKLINNFQDDLRGTFLLKMKRRQRTLNLLAWKFLLNKVKPVRLDDLLLPRLRRRTVNSHYTIQLRKLRYFYGFYRGYRSIFFKRLHSQIKHYRFNRPNRLASLLELRLDVALVRLHFFSNVSKARKYIKDFGVLVNKKLVQTYTKLLQIGDVLTVLPAHKILFKYKILVFMEPSRANLLDLPQSNALLAAALASVKGVDLELSLLTPYVRALQVGRKSGVLNKSIFFQSYFPRYLEVNFPTFDFKCVGLPNPSTDIAFPFRLKTGEAKKLIEATV